jgi:enoyl-CoA hydratase/3-hydroxyacyl-CoA dehydrogenase
MHQLHQAFDEAAADPNVSGIVIAGEGKAFVIGADIGFLIRNIEAKNYARCVQFTKAGHRALNAIDGCPKTVVARLNGAALGAGIEIALACDRVVASPAATVGFPETGLGLYPGFGGTQRTPRAAGVGLAKWMILSGKRLSAADALRIGLIDHIVPPGELEDAARNAALGKLPEEERQARPPHFDAIGRFFESSRADDLRAGTADTGGDPVLARAMKPVAFKAPLALRVSEQLIEEGIRKPLADGLQMEIDHSLEICRTEDALRGLTFFSRRLVGQPVFVGR